MYYRNTMFERINKYLEDPLLQFMYSEIRKAGSMKSVSIDLTSRCNLKCEGCYFFADEINKSCVEGTDEAFEKLLATEKQRGTNFVTVVGGEPSLRIDRLVLLRKHFKISVATNGQIRIPGTNLEYISIGVAIWGNHQTDSRLRGNSVVDVFGKALQNYKNDSRAFFYYTVQPENFDQIEEVTRLCVENGNKVLFNYYSSENFEDDSIKNRYENAHQEILKVIEKYPGEILMPSYVSQVVSSGTLLGEKWGHDVCPNFSVDHPLNHDRMKNGKPFSSHFKSYNSDFVTTRKCCTRNQESCAGCYDVWQHFAWIIINMKKHLSSSEDFANWLSTTYIFYLINRLVDQEAGYKLLPEIQKEILTNLVAV